MIVDDGSFDLANEKPIMDELPNVPVMKISCNTSDNHPAESRRSCDINFDHRKHSRACTDIKFETKLIKPHDSNIDKYLQKPNLRHSFLKEFCASEARMEGMFERFMENMLTELQQKCQRKEERVG
eukprot:UN29130